MRCMDGWMAALFGAVTGALIAVFAEPLRRWIFRPRLELEFRDDGNCVVRTPESDGGKSWDAYYVRIKVRNKSNTVAEGCRAYLVDVEKHNEKGEFVLTEYCDSLPLPWSYKHGVEGYSGIDIPRGINQYLDVLKTTEEKGVFEPKIVMPYRYESLFRQQGVFRLSVQVCAAGAKHKTLKLVFEWHGDCKVLRVGKDALPPPCSTTQSCPG